ncbi:MAG TPA: HAD family phosphatase [Candidatus Avisuccinivibrio pullicola]|nr:HAD family phosphatase [Candidatus Avisuccinivibrio pullicola]
MAIKNLIFDFGGVLLDWNPRYFYNGVFKDEKKADDFIKNICTSEWNAQMDRGVPFAEAIAQLQKEHPEYEREIGLYRIGWDTMLKGEIEEGVRMFRDCVKDGRYPLYGLTNWSAETINVAYRRFSFLKDLEGIVVSGEERMIKPDKRIYQVLLERYHLKPEECVFIDDNPDNVAAAAKLGIHALRCTGDYTALKQELHKLTGINFS